MWRCYFWTAKWHWGSTCTRLGPHRREPRLELLDAMVLPWRFLVIRMNTKKLLLKKKRLRPDMIMTENTTLFYLQHSRSIQPSCSDAVFCVTAQGQVWFVDRGTHPSQPGTHLYDCLLILYTGRVVKTWCMLCFLAWCGPIRHIHLGINWQISSQLANAAHHFLSTAPAPNSASFSK